MGEMREVRRSAMVWTVAEVEALAPDAASARSGRELAQPRRWQGLGTDGDAAWGECQGSGATPYRAAVDLRQTGFRCTCPSRKFPCKHTLGLCLLLADTPERFATAPRPDWVDSWLAGRRRAPAGRPELAPGPGAEPPAEAPAEAPREDARRARVAAGLAEFSLWLGDLVRHGLAGAGAQPARFWETAAARLVDAQAPGLARRVLALGALPAAGGPNWPSAMLERLAHLHLLVEAFGRLDQLPEPVRDEVRAAIGWTVSQEALLAGPGVRDRWHILGRRVEVEDRLRAQRTWLRGEASGRDALVLHFAHGRQPLDTSLLPGSVLDADLVFYPGAVGHRALVKARHAPPEPLRAMPGHASVAEAVAAWGSAVAACPWLDRFPMALRAVVPLHDRGGWRLRCAVGGETLRVVPRFADGWRLLALGGGRAVSVFGEWDGERIRPLGAVAGGRYTRLDAAGDAT